MTRRISRAKQRIKDSGDPVRHAPGRPRRAERLAAVLHVLYLIFNEGYASTSGPNLHRAELSAEAIRLARMVHRLLPDDGEVAGLLALMLLTDARRPARTGPDGALVPMAEQDRSRWNADHIAEGVALITAALPRGATGPYQLQAAIAAVHDEAPNADDDRLAADRRAVRAAAADLRQPGGGAEPRRRGAPWSDGPQAGLDLLGTLEDRRPDRRGPPAARGPRPPAGDGRRPRGGPRRLPEAADSGRPACRSSATSTPGPPASPDGATAQRFTSTWPANQ